MTALLTPGLGVMGGDWRRLVAPGSLLSPLVFARAQVSTSATALNGDGMTWMEHGADVPRFHGTPRRLSAEGQRTNLAGNPRAEGATAGVLGSGGALPSGWSVTVLSGLSVEVLGSVSVQGLPGLRVRFFGTPSATTRGFLVFQALSAPANIPHAVSIFAQAVGTVTGITSAGTRVGVIGAGGSVDGGDFFATIGAFARRGVIATPGSGATGANVSFTFGYASGVAVDATFDICAAQVEQGAFASTPVLPPVGTPGTSTRGTDLVSTALTSLGIGTQGACTILGSFMLPQAAPAGADQMLLQVDGGSDANRFRLRNAAGGSGISAGQVTGGSGSDATGLGSITPGTPFRAGITIDGAGRIAACLNGGTVHAVTGGPTSGLTTLRLGNNAANTAAMFGEVGSLASLPFAVPDAALPNLLSTLPL